MIAHIAKQYAAHRAKRTKCGSSAKAAPIITRSRRSGVTCGTPPALLSQSTSRCAHARLLQSNLPTEQQSMPKTQLPQLIAQAPTLTSPKLPPPGNHPTQVHICLAPMQPSTTDWTLIHILLQPRVADISHGDTNEWVVLPRLRGPAGCFVCPNPRLCMRGRLLLGEVRSGSAR
jgi:hypothetical protein